MDLERLAGGACAARWRERFEALSERIAAARQAEDLPALAAAADEFVAAFPDSWRGYDAKATVAARTLGLSEAIPALRALAARAPEARGPLWHLFTCLLEAGRLAEAERLLETFADRSADPSWRALQRARIAMQADQLDLAERILRSEAPEACDRPRGLRLMCQISRRRGDGAGAAAMLRQLRCLGEARPGEIYAGARLSAQASGGAFGPTDSAAFVEAYPDDEDIAIQHARLVATLPDRLAFADAWLARRPGAVRMRVERAMIDLHAGHPERAVERLARLRAAGGPAGRNLEPALAEALFRADRTEEALALLKVPDESALTVPIAEARWQIHFERGEAGNALREAVRLVRLRPDTGAMRKLFRSLLLSGRFRRAEAVRRGLADSYPHSLARSEALARSAIDAGDLATAREALEHLAGTGLWAGLADDFANVLWQAGEGERADHAVLAAVLKDPALLSPRAAVRRTAAGEHARRIEQLAERARSGASPAERRARLADLSRVLTRSYLLKRSGRLPDVAGSALAACAEAEARGDAAAALAAIEPHLAAILTSTGTPARANLLLRRVAALRKAAGRPHDAVAALKAAARLNCDPFACQRLRRGMRAALPVLSVGRPPRAVVLIVTFAGNLAEAESTAIDIHRHCGRTTFVLLADPGRTGIEPLPRPYGHRLTVPEGDGYEALPAKVAAAFQYLFACTDCAGVLKIDDDAIPCDLERFDRFVDDLAASGLDYCGRRLAGPGPIWHFGRRGGTGSERRQSLHRIVPYASGEVGYYLSRRALGAFFERSVAELPPDAPGIVLEDAYVGDLLDRGGISLVHRSIGEEAGLAVGVFDPLAAARVARTPPAG